MARILFVGGGQRARALVPGLLTDGHAVRITTRNEAGREAIERLGAECWIGDPDRIATLRYSLENVTIAGWLLGSASGTPSQLADLHGSRLEFFLQQAIDTTVRGLLYEAAGTVNPEILAAGADLVAVKAAYNEIPLRVLEAPPDDIEEWTGQARGAIAQLLATEELI